MPRDPFADGRFRYYFPMFGYEMANIAKANVFDVIVRGKKIGTANPGFRQGAER